MYMAYMGSGEESYSGIVQCVADIMLKVQRGRGSL